MTKVVGEAKMPCSTSATWKHLSTISSLHMMNVENSTSNCSTIFSNRTDFVVMFKILVCNCLKYKTKKDMIQRVRTSCEIRGYSLTSVGNYCVLKRTFTSDVGWRNVMWSFDVNQCMKLVGSKEIHLREIRDKCKYTLYKKLRRVKNPNHSSVLHAQSSLLAVKRAKTSKMPKVTSQFSVLNAYLSNFFIKEPVVL